MATVLILGATSDMAIAIAKKFASKNYDIQLASRNTEPIKRLQSDLSIRYDVICSVHAFDALKVESHDLFFQQLDPRPEITICVFGYLGDNEKAMTDWKEAERILHTNFIGAASILNRVGNYYAEIRTGTIVGVSSVAGERGRQSNYMYGSAKAGFTAYLSGLRNRLLRDNVHVVTVKPGFVFTRMTEGLNLPKLLTAQPEEVGEAVFNAVRSRRNVVYVRWFWRWIMLIIKMIPEPLFKKLKL